MLQFLLTLNKYYHYYKIFIPVKTTSCPLVNFVKSDDLDYVFLWIREEERFVKYVLLVYVSKLTGPFLEQRRYVQQNLCK